MSFTYTNDPANSNRDAVRSLLNDTVEASAVFTDEEIAWALSDRGNVYLAASMLCMKAAASGVSAQNLSVGELSRTYMAAPGDQWRTQGRWLRAQGVRGVSPYAGGISRSDKTAQKGDSDWAKPEFTVGQFDDPQSGALSTSTGWS